MAVASAVAAAAALEVLGVGAEVLRCWGAISERVATYYITVYVKTLSWSPAPGGGLPVWTWPGTILGSSKVQGGGLPICTWPGTILGSSLGPGWGFARMDLASDYPGVESRSRVGVCPYVPGLGLSWGQV